MDGRPARRSDGAHARPADAESARAHRLDRHRAVSADRDAIPDLPLLGWAKPVPVNMRNLQSPRRDFALVAARRAGEQPDSGASAPPSCCVCCLAIGAVAAGPVAGGDPAAWSSGMNVLLAVFNMIPVPPLDGGNVLAGFVPEDGRARDRPAAAVRLPRPVRADAHRRARATSCSRCSAIALSMAAVTPAKTRRLRHAADRAGCTSGIWSARCRTGIELQQQYDCFYFVADWHALTSDYADTGALVENALDNVADWIGAGIDPGEEHAVRPVARAGARRAVPAAADGHADSVARARADLQGTDRAARRARTCRTSASSAIRCCRRPTSSSTTRTTCRSARIRCRTSSSRARSSAGSTTSTARLFVEPQPLLTPTPRLPGLDNRKMSKSYGNTIDLSDSPETS